MPKDKLTRTSIPKSLLDAKNFAVAEFLLPDTDERAMAFAARTNPKHNVVGVGLGRKIVKGKLTAHHCVRFYVEQKLPKQAVPNGFMLPEKIKGLPTDVIETGRFRAFAGAAKERFRIRPARPGCSVGFAFSGKDAGTVMAGTFGAVVEATASASFSAIITCSQTRTLCRSVRPSTSRDCWTRMRRPRTR